MSADHVVLLLSAGIGLIYIELNRPGRVVPGALGVLCTLLAAAALGRHGVRGEGILLLAAGAMVLASDLVRPTGIPLAVIAAAALCLGLHELTGGDGSAVTWPVAVGCGLAIGAGTSGLTRIARRARVNKRKV